MFRAPLCPSSGVPDRILLTGALGNRDARLPKAPTSNIKCWKPYAAIYGLALLKMGIVVPETCCVDELLIKLIIVAYCWSIY